MFTTSLLPLPASAAELDMWVILPLLALCLAWSAAIVVIGRRSRERRASPSSAPREGFCRRKTDLGHPGLSQA